MEDLGYEKITNGYILPMVKKYKYVESEHILTKTAASAIIKYLKNAFDVPYDKNIGYGLGYFDYSGRLDDTTDGYQFFAIGKDDIIKNTLFDIIISNTFNDNEIMNRSTKPPYDKDLSKYCKFKFIGSKDNTASYSEFLNTLEENLPIDNLDMYSIVNKILNNVCTEMVDELFIESLNNKIINIASKDMQLDFLSQIKETIKQFDLCMGQMSLTNLPGKPYNNAIRVMPTVKLNVFDKYYIVFSILDLNHYSDMYNEIYGTSKAPIFTYIKEYNKQIYDSIKTYKTPIDENPIPIREFKANNNIAIVGDTRELVEKKSKNIFQLYETTVEKFVEKFKDKYNNIWEAFADYKVVPLFDKEEFEHLPNTDGVFDMYMQMLILINMANKYNKSFSVNPKLIEVVQ